MSKKEEKKLQDEAKELDETAKNAENAQTAETAEDAETKETEANTESSEEKVEKTKKDPKDAIIEELQDKVKRQMAEFDNFRKRTEKEKSSMFEMGATDIIKKLLPIVDNFERGFKSISDEEKEEPFAKGMDMTYKQMMKMLEDVEVKPIAAVGEEFNPEFHNAVMHVEDDSVGESIIVEEFEKGYTYRESVIRHSMVKVAN